MADSYQNKPLVSSGGAVKIVAAAIRRSGYPRRTEHERGIVLAYVQHTRRYSRAQNMRLVACRHANRLADVPLVKLYCALANSHFFKRAYNTRPNQVWCTDITYIRLAKGFV